MKRSIHKGAYQNEIRISSSVLLILLLGFVSQATAQEANLKSFQHAAFSITTPNGKVLLIDPSLNNPSNPEAKDNQNPLVAVSKVDYILLTHGHRDHVGDADEIAKKTGAALITSTPNSPAISSRAAFQQASRDRCHHGHRRQFRLRTVK